MSEPTSYVQPEPQPSKRRWPQALASLLLPGLGQLLLRRDRRALFRAVPSALAAPFVLHWTTVVYSILWFVHVGSAIDTFWLTPPAAAPRRTSAVVALFSVAVMCGLLVPGIVANSFYIPAGSMIPTLQVGDHIAVDATAYWRGTPRRGDVIVFLYPREPDKKFIKRVIGVAGDTIELRHDRLLVNGQPLPRRAVAGDCSYHDYDEYSSEWSVRNCSAWQETLDGHDYVVYQDGEQARGGDFKPVTVPPDSVYVLGDNRDNSHDSRFWGSVPLNLVKGRAATIYWSRGPDGFRWERTQQPVR